MKAVYLLPFALLLLGGCQPPPEAAHGVAPTPPSTTTGGGHIDSLNRTYHLKDLQRVTLKANGHDIKAWVMDNEDKLREGMMWLDAEDVMDDDGMIFVFPDAKPQSFWMKDTILALDIIFISKDKKVLNVQKGMPGNLTGLPSKGDAMYVLEMKQGASERLGIKPKTVVTIPETVKAK